MRSLLATVFVLMIPSKSYGCSFATAKLFAPSLEEWSLHPGPAQTGKDEHGTYWEPVPVPVVHVARVTRGTAAPGSSCADAGTLELEVTLPPDSTYNIDEFGIYFRVVSGDFPIHVFPRVPLRGEIIGKKMRIFLAWLDGAPSDQSPLDFQVEAFFLANDLTIGESTTFAIEADVGG